MWVRILKDHDHRPSPRRMVAYKAGTELSVKEEVGTDLITNGYAEEIPAPSRDDAKAAKETGKLPEPKAK